MEKKRLTNMHDIIHRLGCSESDALADGRGMKNPWLGFGLGLPLFQGSGASMGE